MYFSAMQKDTFGDIIHIIRIDSIYYLCESVVEL